MKKTAGECFVAEVEREVLADAQVYGYMETEKSMAFELGYVQGVIDMTAALNRALKEGEDDGHSET